MSSNKYKYMMTLIDILIKLQVYFSTQKCFIKVGSLMTKDAALIWLPVQVGDRLLLSFVVTLLYCNAYVDISQCSEIRDYTLISYIRICGMGQSKKYRCDIVIQYGGLKKIMDNGQQIMSLSISVTFPFHFHEMSNVYVNPI